MLIRCFGSRGSPVRSGHPTTKPQFKLLGGFFLFRPPSQTKNCQNMHFFVQNVQIIVQICTGNSSDGGNKNRNMKNVGIYLDTRRDPSLPLVARWCPDISLGGSGPEQWDGVKVVKHDQKAQINHLIRT